VIVLEGLCKLATRDVDVHSGDNEVDIDLATLLSVTVRVPEGSEGDELDIICGSNPLGRSRKLDRNLEAAFDCMPAGTYVFTHTSKAVPGGAYGAIDLTSSGTYTFCSAPMNALKVELFFSDGVLGRAGFRDGDIVYAINGERFCDHATLHRSYYHMDMNPGSVLYSVRRGRATKEIAVDWASVIDTFHWAGVLRPCSD
jgi:hypothetical protein